MHRLNKEFDKVVCINLAERPDKKELMQERFDKYGIEVEWFTAVQYGFIPKIVKPINDSKNGKFNENQPFEIGAALSHYHVIKQALTEGCKKIFVFEDDAKFHVDFNKKLDSYLDDLPEDWNMISFYSFMYNIMPQNIRVSKRWLKSYKSWSLMAYGMNEEFMRSYIASQNAFFTIADAVSFNLQENALLKSYTAIPSLCIPETQMGSNIRGQNMNYESNPTITNMGYGDDHYD